MVNNNKKKKLRVGKRSKKQARARALKQLQISTAKNPYSYNDSSCSPSSLSSKSTSSSTSTSTSTSTPSGEVVEFTFRKSASIEEQLASFMQQCRDLTPPRDPAMIFNTKLNGAFARLFAHGCVEYLEKITDEEIVNDTYMDLPAWNGLSPQHRIRLITQLMIGLLCKDEPLELIQTEQHLLTYLAIWKMVDWSLEWELDFEDDSEMTNMDKLEAIRNTCPDHWNDTESKRREKREQEMIHARKKVLTEEEQKEEEEHRRKNAVREKIASKQKRKLEKMLRKRILDDIETDSTLSEDDTRGEEGAGTSSELTLSEIKHYKKLFDGGHEQADSLRAYLKPDCSKEEDRDIYRTFRFRILCDEAFQEHKAASAEWPMSLRQLNFNWKLVDHSWTSVWRTAIEILFTRSGIINYSPAVNKMMALHYGDIFTGDYVNPKKFQRVVNVHKTIQKWRLAFDESYSETQFYQDQGCILSICSLHIYMEYYFQFTQDRLLALYSEYQEHNISFVPSDQNYQKRLIAYRILLALDTPSTSCDSCFEKLCHPKEFKDTEENSYGIFIGWDYEKCNRSGCYGSMEKKLFTCSGCGIITYCSRKCQKKDWKEHKKDCKELAAMYENKEEICNEC